MLTRFRQWWHGRFGHQRHIWTHYCNCGEVNLWGFGRYQEQSLRELRRRVRKVGLPVPVSPPW